MSFLALTTWQIVALAFIVLAVISWRNDGDPYPMIYLSYFCVILAKLEKNE